MRRLLVANRGEIARRVMRTARAMGIATVAVHSDADAAALHVREADAAFALAGDRAADSYLRIDKLIAAAKATRADAVHPGYGFLSENAEFAQAVLDAGLVWVGPPPAAIHALGSKSAIKRLAATLAVPCLPGYAGDDQTDARFLHEAERIGYPVMVKAAAGGGGRGMRVVPGEADLPGALASARSEAEAAFGSGELLLERALAAPRHVEIQVVADMHGRCIHLGERDCSVQRRHQKVIEEAPAPAVDDELRARIGKIGVEAAKAVDYVGAGTIEGLLQDGEYFFLEMNTRVQVEHCVTEMVTGIDIVREGILAAAGEPLSYTQEQVELRGHAIECRINAEDASKNFAPAPGKIGDYKEPAGPGVRVDSGVGPGGEVTPMYDPMVAKLIVWDADREQATRRAIRALHEYEIEGLKTLIPFHIALLGTEQWANGETCRDLLEDKKWLKTLAFDAPPKPAESEDEKVEQAYTVEVSGKRFDVKVIGPPFAGGAAPNGATPAAGRAAPKRGERKSSAGGGADELLSPLQGNMWKVLVEQGQAVEEGQIICIIEAMKRENEVTAHKAGVIETLSVKEGEPIQSGAPIAIIKAPAAE
ncbi:MAG: biotin carboxylase N-terminal domain-containing protein [Burkholderiales bacterium]